jgi:hypothetical protein
MYTLMFTLMYLVYHLFRLFRYLQGRTSGFECVEVDRKEYIGKDADHNSVDILKRDLMLSFQVTKHNIYLCRRIECKGGGEDGVYASSNHRDDSKPIAKVVEAEEADATEVGAAPAPPVAPAPAPKAVPTPATPSPTTPIYRVVDNRDTKGGIAVMFELPLTTAAAEAVLETREEGALHNYCLLALHLPLTAAHLM